MKSLPSNIRLHSSSISLILSFGLVACDDGGGSDGDTSTGGSSAVVGSSTGGNSGIPGAGGDAGGDGGSSPGAGGVVAGGEEGHSGVACTPEERVGSFVTYLLGGDKTVFDGAVARVVSPSAIPEVLKADGFCQVLGPRDLFCATGCEGDTTCAGDDICVPKREKVDAGTVTVTGLKSDVAVGANALTFSYAETFADPYPGFDGGAAIHLSSDGGVVGAFSMDVFGVPVLTTDMQDLAVSSTAAVNLTWNVDGVNAEQSEVFLNFTINSHGALTGWIECVAPDTGTLEISQVLIEELMGKGLSGFPRMRIGRRSVDHATTADGCVDFSVESTVTVDLVVDGIVSCSDSVPCPDGGTCKEPEKFCE